MAENHLLNEDELNSVFGGLDFNKLSASEMAEYNRLQDIYMDAMRKAMKDASLMPAADKAYDELEAYSIIWIRNINSWKSIPNLELVSR